MNNVCVGCGLQLDNANRHWCSVKCYQKHYQKKYYEDNADWLRAYGCEYFQKNKAKITAQARVKRQLKRND
jgi:nuclear transport factor 2 (NTF2) superfamily protein